MVFCAFIFFFYFSFFVQKQREDKTTVRATSTTIMVTFWKVLFRKLPYHSYVKVSSEQLRDALTTALEGHPTVEDFIDMDQDMC